MADNPHAFPRSGPFSASGMTLRDWFAGQAIVGMLARGYGAAGTGVLADKTASDAYGLADTLLAERSKP